MTKSENALLTIGEISQKLNLAPSVIRFWETQFKGLKPLKYNSRRYYTDKNLKLLQQIQDLLHEKDYSIKEAQKIIKSSKQNTSNIEKIYSRLTAARIRLDSILKKSKTTC